MFLSMLPQHHGPIMFLSMLPQRPISQKVYTLKLHCLSYLDWSRFLRGLRAQ